MWGVCSAREKKTAGGDRTICRKGQTKKESQKRMKREGRPKEGLYISPGEKSEQESTETH